MISAAASHAAGALAAAASSGCGDRERARASRTAPSTATTDTTANTPATGWPLSIRQKLRKTPTLTENATAVRSSADRRDKTISADPARNSCTVKRLRTINKRHVPVLAHQLA